MSIFAGTGPMVACILIYTTAPCKAILHRQLAVLEHARSDGLPILAKNTLDALLLALKCKFSHASTEMACWSRQFNVRDHVILNHTEMLDTTLITICLSSSISYFHRSACSSFDRQACSQIELSIGMRILDLVSANQRVRRVSRSRTEGMTLWIAVKSPS